MTADEFTNEVCGAIKKTCGIKPNDLFETECRALGRLVEKGELPAKVASEQMMLRFVKAVMKKGDI